MLYPIELRVQPKRALLSHKRIPAQVDLNPLLRFPSVQNSPSRSFHLESRRDAPKKAQRFNAGIPAPHPQVPQGRQNRTVPKSPNLGIQYTHGFPNCGTDQSATKKPKQQNQNPAQHNLIARSCNADFRLQFNPPAFFKFQTFQIGDQQLSTQSPPANHRSRYYQKKPFYSPAITHHPPSARITLVTLISVLSYSKGKG
jgi:hypothetical protein